jgi:hypothetical protein
MTSDNTKDNTNNRPAEYDQSDELRFDSIKKHCGDYFVTYQPPVSSPHFATIALVFLKPTDSHVIATAMEAELQKWASRYKIPVMVSAFDNTDSLISLTDIRPENHLVGWCTLGDNKIVQSWKLNDLETFIKTNTEKVDLKNVYVGVPFRTKADIKAASDKKLAVLGKQIRTLKIFLVVWWVIVPIATATLEYFAPSWLTLLIYVYSFWTGYRTWRKLSGRKKPSKREIEKAEKERKMQHYYHHCERNPMGFARLKVENFEEDAREDIKKEASQIV